MSFFSQRTWIANERARERRHLVSGLRESAARVSDAIRAGDRASLCKAIEKGERQLHSCAVIADQIRRSEIRKVWAAITAIAYEQAHASAALDGILTSQFRLLLNDLAELDLQTRTPNSKRGGHKRPEPKHSEYAKVAQCLPICIDEMLESERPQRAINAGEDLFKSLKHIAEAIQLAGLETQWRHLVATAQRSDRAVEDLQFAAVCCLDCLEGVYRLLFGVNRWILRRAVKAQKELHVRVPVG